MPVEFLTDEEVAAYGRFNGPPSRVELERSFLLNDRDRELVGQRRRPHTRLGFALQLGTVREGRWRQRSPRCWSWPPPPDEEADEAWRAELLKRHQTIRPFLPVLTEVLEFGAVEGGHLVVEAVRQLPELLTRKKVGRDEITAGLVTGAWRRLVNANLNGDPDVVDHRAYTFCVLEHLHRGLNRRDVFAKGSDRWGDPQARLLSGEAWDQAKGDVVTALQLTEQPDPHLPRSLAASTLPTGPSPRGCPTTLRWS